MGDRKDFSQTELLKYLGQFTVNRARCEKCGELRFDDKINLCANCGYRILRTSKSFE